MEDKKVDNIENEEVEAVIEETTALVNEVPVQKGRKKSIKIIMAIFIIALLSVAGYMAYEYHQEQVRQEKVASEFITAYEQELEQLYADILEYGIDLDEVIESAEEVEAEPEGDLEPEDESESEGESETEGESESLDDTDEEVEELDYYEAMELNINFYEEYSELLIAHFEKIEVEASSHYVSDEMVEEFNAKITAYVTKLEELQENTVEEIRDTYIEDISKLIEADEKNTVDSLTASNKTLQTAIDMMSEENLEAKYLTVEECQELIEEAEELLVVQKKALESAVQKAEEEAAKLAASQSTTTSSGSSSNSSSNSSSGSSSSSSSSSSSNSSSSSSSSSSSNGITSYSSTSEEAAMLSLINAERSKQGLGTLSYSSSLYTAAKIRGVEITTVFSHTRPNGTSFSTVGGGASGENIAYGYTTASAAYNGFYNSTGHRENMLRSNFTKFACNRVIANGRAYWVQLFGY